MLSSALSVLGSTLDTRGTGIPLSLYTDEECVSPSTSAPNEPNPISLGFQGISLANENLKIVKFKKLVNR
jgi:hypothetical protein